MTAGGTNVQLVAAALALGLCLSGTSAAADTPDASITMKTTIALMTTDHLSVADLNVDTADGVVTIQGKVATEAEKMKAEQVAGRIDGVTSVKNLLQIVPASKREVVDRADADVKEAVEAAFRANARVKDSGISVASVNKGVVALAGTAASLESHLEAVQVAYAVKGVRRVSSEVQVTSGTRQKVRGRSSRTSRSKRFRSFGSFTKNDPNDRKMRT
jgi:hyperosmotically inducible protein